MGAFTSKTAAQRAYNNKFTDGELIFLDKSDSSLVDKIYKITESDDKYYTGNIVSTPEAIYNSCTINTENILEDGTVVYTPSLSIHTKTIAECNDIKNEISRIGKSVYDQTRAIYESPEFVKGQQVVITAAAAVATDLQEVEENAINLTEIKIFDEAGIDVTFNATARQDTDYKNDPESYPASNVLDNDFTNFQHNNSEGSLYIDLKEETNIKSIVVINRAGFEERIVGGVIEIRDSQGSTVWESTFNQPQLVYTFNV